MKVNDLTVNNEESGEGKPLFLLHGGGPALSESEINKIIQEEKQLLQDSKTVLKRQNDERQSTLIHFNRFSVVATNMVTKIERL
ncbi:MAG: hypothetical protein MUO67_18935 [Anaerolineales bacterium]|nr:hypothetical protein [Anaerolineales bacterium]